MGKTDAAGNTIFGTLLGGPTADAATALAVDSAGNVVIAGFTGGSFPTTANAAITDGSTAVAGHGGSVFAAKISADGNRILYSTYLPSSAVTANAIAIDAQGAAYIGGKSAAGHAYVLKLSSDGGTILYNSYAFVARLDSKGKRILSTYLGGSGSDVPITMGADAVGNIYIAGSTTSQDFPTTLGTFQPAPIVPLWSDGAPSGFIAKISADFRTAGYSSYVMTAGIDGVVALGVTPDGDAYLAGNTGAGFPVTANAPQSCFQGPLSVFLAHVNADGALQEATYVGGNASGVSRLSVATDGTIRIAWNSFAAPKSVVSEIRFGGPEWTAPDCLSPTVLNAATFYGDDQGVAPGELISLTGFGIGPDNGATYQPDAQGRVPRELAGVRVLFDGEPAPVLYAQSRQVNAQAPFELSGKTVTNISLVYNEVTIGSIKVRANAGRPGIFRLHPGVSSQAAAANQDGTVNGVSNPAARNSIVSIWGTGFPPLDPSCATGGLNPPEAVNLAAGWVVTLSGGIQGVYAGSAPGQLCGIVQINLLLPSTAGAVEDLRPQYGNPMTGKTGGSSAIGATVAVK